MAHKVHPKIFRIRSVNDWFSKGFYQKNFAQCLKEDYIIRKFLEKKIGEFGVEKIEIERSPLKINIIISTSRPGLVIGRRGEEIENLRKEIEKLLITKPEPTVRIEIKEVPKPWMVASLVAKWMAEQIQKRVPYRRVLKQALAKIMSNKEVKGARVQVAGRLDGVEIARTEWLQNGNLPRQTIRADIDYAYKRAYCRYGVIGVKVWIYKGEKFD